MKSQNISEGNVNMRRSYFHHVILLAPVSLTLTRTLDGKPLKLSRKPSSLDFTLIATKHNGEYVLMQHLDFV
jgi:hypothetical protein